MGWINSSQQNRDHTGLRNCCAACGHEGTTKNPLGKSDDGYRIHESHFKEPGKGFFGRRQKD